MAVANEFVDVESMYRRGAETGNRFTNRLLPRTDVT